MQQEMRTATAAAPLGPLTITQDFLTGRNLLSRPRSNLEALSVVMMAQDPAFGAGISHYIVARDPRGVAVVPLVSGKLPSPFVDITATACPTSTRRRSLRLLDG